MTTTSDENEPATPPGDVMTRLESMLEHWRARVDEFMVQLDLAHMEIRDGLRAALTRGDESATAFHSRLERRISELRDALPKQRKALQRILRDVQKEVEASGQESARPD